MLPKTVRSIYSDFLKALFNLDADLLALLSSIECEEKVEGKERVLVLKGSSAEQLTEHHERLCDRIRSGFCTFQQIQIGSLYFSLA